MYTPNIRYTDRRVNYFDFCHVDVMSMIEIIDMINELGFEGTMRCFWKSLGGALINNVVRPLLTQILMLSIW